jgi:nitronate monooxygenase
MAASDRLRATGDDTVRTKAIDTLRGVPWPDEFSFRVVRNHLTEQWAHREAERLPLSAALGAYAEARARQDFDMVAVVAGECVGLIDDRPSATASSTLWSRAQLLLRRGATLDFAEWQPTRSFGARLTDP